jgi:hypothetical protein
MKKYLIIIIVSVVSVNLYSQIEAISPETGLVLSRFRKSIIPDEGIKIGGMLGVTASYRLTNTLSLRFGLMLDQKGNYFTTMFTNAFGEPVGDAHFYITNTYMGIPVLLHVKIHRGFYFEGGGYLNYMVRSKEVIVWGKDRDSVSRFVPDLDTLKFKDRFNKGLYAGFGISIPLAEKQSLQVLLKYDYPLVFNENRLKYHALCLSLGYRFKLRE